MFVKPGMRPDDRERALVVRAPNGRLLSELGGEVPETQFWHRRLRDGDVVPAEPIPREAQVRHVMSDGSLTIETIEPGFDPAVPPMKMGAAP